VDEVLTVYALTVCVLTLFNLTVCVRTGYALTSHALTGNVNLKHVVRVYTFGGNRRSKFFGGLRFILKIKNFLFATGVHCLEHEFKIKYRKHKEI